MYTNKNFIQSISEEDICLMLSRQLNNFVPDNRPVTPHDLQLFVQITFQRLYQCFKWIKNKYYCNESDVLFNHLQSDHYCSFLYLISNTAYNQRANDIATKIFLLNKYLHGLDLYFSVTLPEVFMLVHPVGSVLGNAEYANFFVAYQNCTVGSVFKEGKYIYPKFEEDVVLYARSAVIGKCHIDKNVIIGANTFIINSNVPANTIVTGTYPNLEKIKKKDFESPFFYK